MADTHAKNPGPDRLQHRLIQSSLKTMVQLKDANDLSVSLGTFDIRVPDGVVIEHVTADTTHAMVLKKGLRLFLHAGAPGKAYLAHLPAEELEDVLNRLTLTRFTENTITTREGLLRELETVRGQGYAVDNSEYVTYTGCVGAAILDDSSYPVGAIWMHGIIQHLREKTFAELGAQIAQAACQIAVNMNGNQYRSRKEYADFVIEHIRRHLTEQLSIDVDVKALAKQYHISYSALGHWFKEREGCGPSQYRLQIRLKTAMQMIKCSQEPVTAIAAKVGFKDHVHFSKMFRKKFGKPPLQFRD